MENIAWEIGRAGRAWSEDEAIQRHNLLPEPTKIELHQGRLFWSDEERLLVVAMLLENLGIDKVIRLLDPDLLFEALAIHAVGEEKLMQILDGLDRINKGGDK